jgi:hypothetical protein
MSRIINMFGPLDAKALSSALSEVIYVIDGTPMPTAILMGRTRDGFVAVSDGKSTNGKADSNHEQKIFAAKGPSLKLMYGVSGVASILDEGTEVLQPLYRPLIEGLAVQSFPNLGSYADEVIVNLRPILRDEIQKSKPLPESIVDPDHPLRFKIQFAGYCNDTPVMTERELCLWSDKWCVTTSEPSCAAYPGCYSRVGSRKIIEKLVGDHDDEFHQFKTAGFMKIIRKDGSISRDEFIDGATKYIQACMTPKARDIDEYCKSIGGDIWQATLAENGEFDVRVIVPFNGSV